MRIFIHQSFCDEYGVVVALSEYEGSKDDIDDVEPDVEEVHNT